MSFDRRVLSVAVAALSLAFAARGLAADDAAEKARKKLEKKEIRFRAKEFIEAVESGEMDVIDLFLTAGMDVNGKGSYGNTALHVAASNENAKVMARLLKAKPDVNALNDQKRTPLYESVHSGQLSRGKNTLPLLIGAGADLKIRYRYGQTIVHEAVDNDNPDALQILIKAGAEVDAKDEHGKTPLFEAAGLRPKLVPILTAAGANPNARESPQGETALMSAANVGEAESIKALLKAGADAKATDSQGTTALHYAARMNRASMQSLKIPESQYVETIQAL
ncbi:MAG TPA: ankyrin repeat domain-containing protein, partial [Thermoanaerobaculia bacterium]|nr:ankyrin repeat domain-containing protein [Thermoanaerobaculia bacterium]